MYTVTLSQPNSGVISEIFIKAICSYVRNVAID